MSMPTRLKSRHSIASGGLSSLRLTSNLAAAVFSGLGHAPLPGMFKWDPAKFEEELRIARRLRRKQKVIGCFKKLLAFLFSQVGLAGTVIFYSLIGGLMFQHIEREQEIADKQRFSELKFKHINNTLDFFVQQLERLDYDLRLSDNYNDAVVTDPATTTTSTSATTTTSTTTATMTTTFNKYRTRTNRTLFVKPLTTTRQTTIKRTTTTAPTTTAATTEATRDLRERLLAEGSEILLRYFSDFQSEVTDAVKSGGWDGKDEIGEAYLQWSFPGALLYAVTVITTIGYGHIAPKTKVGRLLTIGYALIGIPLTFLYLSNIGNFLGESLKKICCGVCCCMQCKRRKDREILRLRRKQRFLSARQELSMAPGGQYDPMDRSELHDDLQEVIAEKESLLYPTERPDPDYIASFQRPPSSTNTSISLSSSDRAALFVSMKNEENHRQASSLISHDHGQENQVKFDCSVTITPPEDDKLRMIARERKHRPSLTVEGSRFSPTTIQEEFHAEESSPSKVDGEGTLRSSAKKSRGTSRKKKRTTNMNLSLTKRFEELEETAILSDDYHSPAEEIKETSILDDLRETDPPPPVKIHDVHRHVSANATSTPRAHNPGESGLERKTCIKLDSGKHSSSKHKVKKTLFTLYDDDDNDDDTRRFASLEMLPLATAPKEKAKRMTRANTEDDQDVCLKRVETAPVGTGLMSNNSVEASRKSSSSKRNSRKTLPPAAKSKSIKESEDKDSKIAASSLVIGHGSKKHSHSFNENLKTKRRKSQSEFEVSTNNLRRIHTVPLQSTRERSKREPKSSSTQKKSNDSEKSQKKSKSKKKQPLPNSDRYRSDYDMIRAFNSYNRATSNYLLPPSLRARYAGRARNASFSQEVINTALKNSERKMLTNQQQPLSFPADKTGDANPGLRTRPASVVELKSLTDLRNQVAIQNRPLRTDHISSAVSYIMLQSAAEANRGEFEEYGNHNLGGNTYPGVASPSDLFLQDNPLLDFDDDDLKDQSHDHKVPIYVCLIIITGYISGGAMLFCTWEKWDYIASSYFCFITLSTIGFGDIVPGTDVNKWASHEKLVLCTLWLALGLSLLAMCFNLMQESVKERFRKFGQRIGLLKSQDGTI